MELINKWELSELLSDYSFGALVDVLQEEDIERLQWKRGRLFAINEIIAIIEEWGDEDEDERH